MSNDLYFPTEYTIVSRTRSLISQIRYMLRDKIQKKREKGKESNLLSAFSCHDLILWREIGSESSYAGFVYVR